MTPPTVDDVVIVCNLLLDVPSPEMIGLFDLFLSKGILLHFIIANNDHVSIHILKN